MEQSYQLCKINVEFVFTSTCTLSTLFTQPHSDTVAGKNVGACSFLTMSTAHTGTATTMCQEFCAYFYSTH